MEGSGHDYHHFSIRIRFSNTRFYIVKFLGRVKTVFPSPPSAWPQSDPAGRISHSRWSRVTVWTAKRKESRARSHGSLIPASWEWRAVATKAGLKREEGVEGSVFIYRDACRERDPYRRKWFFENDDGVHKFVHNSKEILLFRVSYS